MWLLCPAIFHVSVFILFLGGIFRQFGGIFYNVGHKLLEVKRIQMCIRDRYETVTAVFSCAGNEFSAKGKKMCIRDRPGCGQCDRRDRCRTVRLGDLRERKKRPHLVENQIQKSFKEQFK